MLIVIPQDSSRFDIIAARVLNTTIGMMHQPRCWLTLSQCHLQGLLCKSAVELTTQAPTHHPARVHIQNHRQIDEFLLQSHVGDIGDPQLIDVR